MSRASRSASFVAFVALVACSSTSSEPTVPADAPGPSAGLCGGCAEYADAEIAGTLASKELVELSGLAASLRHDGVFYTHNDSGDRARFFALDERAGLRATYELAAVTATDIEDIAVGPCPAGACVFLGDIGDNDARRAEVQVYRVPEPELADGRLTPEVLTLTYPDGPHNAETLLVSPDSGDLVIVTKTPTGRSGVYTAPANAVPGRAVLRKVGEVVVPPVGGGLVTGGALHPCEKRVVLRTYTVMLEYRFTGGLETLFEGAPTVIAAGREPQGEAVTYSANGRSIFTISEGKSAPLHRSDCAR
ncbi:MAG TPA: hypothetical protein PLR99_20835 [Polyangiaceae bacterium]|nr:hypothetical protein [Polyangiaceae bacterium]